MSDVKYTYAVARIRALEVSLFSASAIEQLIACKNYDACLDFLKEKGWGDAEQDKTAESILTTEEERIWQVMAELSVDRSNFEILFYTNWFHNLKAAIKNVCTKDKVQNIYYKSSFMPPEELEQLIREQDFGSLPENMQEAAKDAFETLLHSRDGQLCDCIIDQACLKAIRKAGKASHTQVIRTYAETTVALADIKIAVRSCKTGKSREFMMRSMAECDSLNVENLAKAALAGESALYEYLEGNGYRDAVEQLKRSYSAFERWCDNHMIEAIKPQKTNPFSIGPLVGYVLGRENEIKTVRIILTCKQNGLGDDAIRERVREMYV